MTKRIALGIGLLAAVGMAALLHFQFGSTDASAKRSDESGVKVGAGAAPAVPEKAESGSPGKPGMLTIERLEQALGMKLKRPFASEREEKDPLTGTLYRLCDTGDGETVKLDPVTGEVRSYWTINDEVPEGTPAKDGLSREKAAEIMQSFADKLGLSVRFEPGTLRYSDRINGKDTLDGAEWVGIVRTKTGGIPFLGGGGAIKLNVSAYDGRILAFSDRS